LGIELYIIFNTISLGKARPKLMGSATEGWLIAAVKERLNDMQCCVALNITAGRRVASRSKLTAS